MVPFRGYERLKPIPDSYLLLLLLICGAALDLWLL